MLVAWSWPRRYLPHGQMLESGYPSASATPTALARELDGTRLPGYRWIKSTLLFFVVVVFFKDFIVIYVQMNCSIFNQFPVDGHLGCFWSSAKTTNAETSNSAHTSSHMCTWLGGMPGSGRTESKGCAFVTWMGIVRTTRCRWEGCSPQDLHAISCQSLPSQVNVRFFRMVVMAHLPLHVSQSLLWLCPIWAFWSGQFGKTSLV